MAESFRASEKVSLRTPNNRAPEPSNESRGGLDREKPNEGTTGARDFEHDQQNGSSRPTLNRSLLVELADLFDREALETFGDMPFTEAKFAEGERLEEIANTIRLRATHGAT